MIKILRYVRNGIKTLLVLFAVGLTVFTSSPVIAAPHSQELSNKVYLPFISKGLPGYFVSPNGNDLNPGTFNQPWRTIGKAARSVLPGDTVYVRAGIYMEAVSLNISGTQQNPIKFLAYPGETPVIDGENRLPSSYDGLLYIKGDWIQISGFEVRNSAYIGVQLHGQHDTADAVYSHNNQKTGIWVQGDYGTVENSRLWQNGLASGSAALSTARDENNGTTDYGVLRNNTVWENKGIGIDSYESNGTIIEGNIVHDNANGNIYISDATNVLCSRNYIYMTPGSMYYGGQNTNFGILLGDEKYTPPSDNITVINNIAYGNNFNLKWHAGDGGYGIMKNVLIANNTFVNTMPNTQGNANLDISDGPHQNVRIMNNIIVQDDSQLIEDIPDVSGITFSHNLWSKTPHANVLGTGSIVKDPKLARTGSPYNNYLWFELTDGSPAINAALSLPEVTVDFLGTVRGSPPDLGALEY